jgi:hypothetical protein
MQDNVMRYLAGMAASQDRSALMPILRALADRYSSQMHSTAGLVIKAGSSALAKNGSACYGTVQGMPFTIAINTDMAALSGTTLQNTHNVYVFYIDSAATMTSAMGVGNATLANVKFPPTPEGKTIIGYIKVNPTAADFVGGTTALDAANTNVIYVNIIGAMDPTLLLG